MRGIDHCGNLSHTRQRSQSIGDEEPIDSVPSCTTNEFLVLTTKPGIYSITLSNVANALNLINLFELFDVIKTIIPVIDSFAKCNTFNNEINECGIDRIVKYL